MAKRIPKTILYVAERKDWREWTPLARIRPSVEKDVVVRALKLYHSQRGQSYTARHTSYRVVPYRQDPNGAVAV